MTQPTPRTPSDNWVRDVLGRNILTAAQDVRTAASYQYAGDLAGRNRDFVHTFMVTHATWTIIHNRTYDGDRVDGFEVVITCKGTATPEHHLRSAVQFLEQAGYGNSTINGDAGHAFVHAFMVIDEPFTPLAYA